MLSVLKKDNLHKGILAEILMWRETCEKIRASVDNKTLLGGWALATGIGFMVIARGRITARRRLRSPTTMYNSNIKS